MNYFVYILANKFKTI